MYNNKRIIKLKALVERLVYYYIDKLNISPNISINIKLIVNPRINSSYLQTTYRGVFIRDKNNTTKKIYKPCEYTLCVSVRSIIELTKYSNDYYNNREIIVNKHTYNRHNLTRFIILHELSHLLLNKNKSYDEAVNDKQSDKNKQELLCDLFAINHLKL